MRQGCAPEDLLRQRRVGRALLEIIKTQLAASAGLGLSTVVDFEKKWRQVSQLNCIELIFQTLHVRKLKFSKECKGELGDRLRRHRRAKQSSYTRLDEIA